VLADLFNIQLDVTQLGSLQIANSVRNLETAAYLKAYFDECGDCIPNRDGEIQIEPMDKTEIYGEYCLDCSGKWDIRGVLSESRFNDIWNRVFAHVKTRQDKAVGMTCKTCTILSYARRKSKVPEVRRQITALHAFHR